MKISEKNLQDALILWRYHNVGRDILTINNSIIIGLGSYELRVADFCARLFRSGIGNQIIFTGKNGNWTTDLWGEQCIEAEIFANRVKSFIPEKDIILEKEARNIGENILFSRRLINEANLIYNNIILATKPNTTRRAYATTLALWPEVKDKLLVTSPSYNFDDISLKTNTESIISELVGDLERIIVYPDKGFQIPQEIPFQVIEAYDRLRNSGFTTHCLKA